MRPAVAYRAVGLAAALVIGALVAKQLLTVLMVLGLTIIFSLPLAAAASLAERFRLPRAVGALGALLAMAGVLIGLGFALAPQFVSQARQFAHELPKLLSSLHFITGTSGQHLKSQLSSFVNGYLQHPQKLIGPIEQVGLTAAALLIGLVVSILVAFMIAVRPDPLIRGFLSLVPSQGRDRATSVLRRVRVAWLGWMTAIGLDMLILGGLLFVGMEIIGLNFALGFAVFSAVMTVIPNYGSVISAIPPIIAGLAVSPVTGVLVLVVYLVVNQIEGNIILPLVMASRVEIHPAMVSIGLLVMGALFGVIGVVLAIPLLSLVVILVETLWIEPMEHAAAPPPLTAISTTAR